MKKRKNYFFVNFEDLKIKDINNKSIDAVALANALLIPEEYQKFVMVVNYCLRSQGGWLNPNYYHYSGLYELISGHPFDMYSCKVEKNECGLKIAKGVPSTIYGGNMCFDAELNHQNADEIALFYKRLIDSGLFENYREVMYTLFTERFKDYSIALDDTLIDLVKAKQPKLSLKPFKRNKTK